MKQLCWNHAMNDHSRQSFPETLGVSDERCTQLCKTVEDLIPMLKDKGRIIDKMLTDGIVANVHEAVVVAAYVEACAMRASLDANSEKIIQDQAKLGIAIATGMLTHLFETGNIDEFVRKGKEEHANGKLKIQLGDALVKGSEGVQH